MNTNIKHRWLRLAPFVLLPVLAGCSALGFSSYPVAHIMTDDTKAVLASTPGMPNVPRELAKEVLPDHYLQPGDEVLLETVSDDTDIRLPADQQVMADGTIDLGAYGRVVVASLTLEQAEAAIQQSLADQSDESVAVNVRMIQPIHRYYVIGEVNSPGAYPLSGHETVLDAILEAGGLTTRASACDLLLARPTQPCSCRVTLPVCYRAITQLGDTTTNYHLQPGDRIFVARQSMHEELMAVCHGGQTCERCCKKQVACRDARGAISFASLFMPSSKQTIEPIEPPPADETATDEPAADGPSTLPGQDVDLPSESELRSPQPNGQLPEPQGPLDGELDFGMLLK
ncbi:polysaccharide export protein [Stieleria sp. TO1_6]|uniref:polysaccharide biosynthesis/export family protein n=1 Tax=Stieleria tagensis TaxID=2956795 RepID=UPI00209B11BB|nr:polysaccharide biosynthesis/export family protein [Stieleria tagensis]MCO8121639.1 polysaccharide export protein [Stieleria tagensis]